MTSHRVHRWLSRNVFLPSLIHGPWTRSRRLYRSALTHAHYGFSHWERSDPEQRAQWILKELRFIVRWAGASVPYYREVFRKVGFDPQVDFGFADYARLPPLEKTTVRERSDDLIAEGFSKNKMRQDATGGSTGAPVRFWLDESDVAWRDAASDWGFSKVGCRLGDRVGLIWGFSVDPRAPHMLGQRIASWFAHRQVNDCFRLCDEALDRIDGRLEVYKPEFLRCYTSALTLLANRLKQRGKKPLYPTRGIITGAEKLDSTQRRIIEDVFSLPVFESYGSRDCGLIAMQLACGDGRLHVAGANIMVEADHNTDSNFGSEILVTDIHKRGMPFLRYRLGDCAHFEANSKDEPVEFLERVTGRKLDHVLLPGGRLVHSVEFSHLFKDFDICEYQVIQAAEGAVRVALVAGSDLTHDNLAHIERILRENLQGVSFSLSLVSAIERGANGKLRPVISHYQPAVSPHV